MRGIMSMIKSYRTKRGACDENHSADEYHAAE